MSVETMIETSKAAGIPGMSLICSPHIRSPSPPSSNALASHLLAAVSQVQSLTSQLPSSVPLPSGSPPLGGCGGYRPVGLLGTNIPQLHLGAEPPMSSLIAGLKDFPRPYHSPPPLPSSENHECKIVEYRGSKVAAFIINGDTMLCLPQAFEIFLKHLVGGLHTVYTKLKRLGIEPLVCNVDQVRILRGLGAIQPGVNRCKLLCVKHFDLLYRDCTTARPGRPPKRASDFMSITSSPESIFEIKKRHLENGSAGFNGHIGSDMRLDKSPLLSNGYHAPPHFNPLQYMANHMAGLGYPPFLPAGLPGAMTGNPGSLSHPISPPESSPMKQIKSETLARFHEERIERERQLMLLDVRRGLPTNSLPSSVVGITHTQPSLPHPITSVPLTPNHTSYDDHLLPPSPIMNLSKCATSDITTPHCREDEDRIGERRSHNSSRNEENIQSSTTPITNINHITNHNSSNLSSSGIGRDEERTSDMDDDDLDKDELAMDTGDMWSLNSSTPGQTQLTPPPPIGNSSLSAPLSSTEVLLRNILGLLRVAEENARHHERQTQYEKAELKMEVLRERELRETLEKQLQEEQKNRVLMQKRCAKLKKLRRRLQERLDIEVKRRSRYEDHLQSASPELLGDINGSLRKDMQAIAVELHKETLKQQEECNQAKAEVIMSSTPMTTLPAITAASIATSNWR